MKILLISNLCPPDYEGGFELAAFRSAQALRKRGHEVDIVTSQYRKTYLGERTDPDWVHRIFEVVAHREGWNNAGNFLEGKSQQAFSLWNLPREFPLRFKNLRNLAETMTLGPKNQAKLDKFLDNKQYDVAYVFGLHLIGTSVIHAARNKGIPVVYHLGDEWLAGYTRPGRLKRTLLKLLVGRSFQSEVSIPFDRVVLISRMLEEMFLSKGFAPNSLRVIPRGVEFELGTDITRERREPPTFFIGSRLAHFKGIPQAIQAAKLLDEEEPDKRWEMKIAGGGDTNVVEEYHQMVRDLNLGHRIEFLGRIDRSEVLGHMRSATAVLSPIIYDEPLGNSNLEALGSGTPLIGARAGAMPEIIENEVSGLMYDRQDVPALVTCMKRVMNDKDLAQRLSEGGLERVRKVFSMDATMSAIEGVFDDAIHNRPFK